MGRRNLLTKYQVWTSLNSAAPTTSTETVVDQMDNIKYVITIAADVIGTLQVEFSDDKLDQNEVWVPLNFGQTLSLNGATDTNYSIIIQQPVCHKLRLKFTNATGSGVINAWVSGASVGA